VGAPWSLDSGVVTFDSAFYTMDAGTEPAEVIVNPQFFFGPGVGWLTPLQDAFGNQITNPSPILIAQMQDVGLDFSAEVKQLYGSNAFAIAIGRGKQKMTVKIKNAQVHGALWNALFFGQNANLVSGIYANYYDQTGIIVPSGGGPVVPVTTYASALPTGAAFGYNLGVRDSANLPLTRVATSPATRQYTVASGSYQFATADVGVEYYFDFNYTASATALQKKMQIQNLLMGQAPLFQFDMIIPYLGNLFSLTLYNCMSSKMSIQTKLDDFSVPDFEFDAFAPGASPIGELSWSM